MQEFDLQKIWGQGDQAAKAHYRSIEPEVEQMATRRSSNVLRKVLRNALAELSFSLLCIGLIVLFFDSDTNVFWAFVAAGIAASIISGYFFIRLRKKLKAVPQTNLRESLMANIQILRQFVNRLYLYTYLFLPIGFYVGALSSMSDHSEIFSPSGLKTLLVITAIGIPLLLLMGWFVKAKYIRWLYGKHLEELEGILAHLEKN